ncbi:hypothetical protein F4805DRAFT_442122 [Annulohypoxylon moriforme]|nr:hypothetical protein F4805DRAFT_442122 [Annulohypoxylon moriforme]
MDDDSMDIDIEAEAWRRDRLGDEPIYCAAPPPSNPDDIICFGSDEELDEDQKIAKRLRYETQGLRYLQGKPKRIFSAALNGPFEKASGWKNPWLPKQPTNKNAVPISQPTIKPLPAIKPRLRKYLEQNDTTPGTSNSMRCHLPSPESNRELQLSGSPPETDKHSRIQAWAKDVSQGTVLDKDAFWAPNQVYSEDADGSSKKRPAAKDWLKKQSKRKRLSTLQDVATKSTPTPLLASTRCNSVPTYTDQIRKPVIPRKMTSQSFELPTPSSTANQSVSEAPYGGQYQHSTRPQAMPPRANLSEISEVAIKNSKIRSTNKTVGGTYNQPFTADDQTHKCDSNIEAEDYTKRACESPRNNRALQSQKADDISSESYLDESFHYRTRPTKQVFNVEEPMADIYPELTQTRTPSSQVHEDAISTAAQEPPKPSQLPQSSPTLKQQIPVERTEKHRAKSLPDRIHYQEGSAIENIKEYFSISPRSKTGPSKDQQPLVENSNSTDSSTIDVSIPSESTNALHIRSETIRNNEQSPAQDDPSIPQVLREENIAQDVIHSRTLAEDETYPTGNQPMVEVGYIGDSVEIDGSTLYEAKGISTSHHISHELIPEVIPRIEQNERMEITMNKETEGIQSDTISNSVTVLPSQLEWGVTKVPDKPTEESKMVNESEASILGIKTEKALDEDGSMKSILSEPLEVIPPQSPWVTELAPGADLTIGHVKSEPVDDIPLLSPCPSHLTLLSSQPSGHGTPTIRPSQQSPWGGKLLDPLKIEHGHLTDMEAMPMSTHPITTISPIQQSPWAESSTGFMPHPNNSSLSPAPVLMSEEQQQSYLQPPMAAVRHCPGPSKEGPATPPRIPASHVRTPDLERSIKSFAMFNSPSPNRQVRQSARHTSSIGYSGDILSDAPNSGRSTRRVTFALYPEDEDIEPWQPLSVGRAASPPPQTAVNADDEDVGEFFHNHFDIMRRRASGEKIRRRSRPLLPSSSQQMPMSPSVGAMAEAFQVADTYNPLAQVNPVGNVTRDVNHNTHGGKQSPWRKESQGADDVADVMNNLDDFISGWDMEAELQKVNQEPSRGFHSWDMDI